MSLSPPQKSFTGRSGFTIFSPRNLKKTSQRCLKHLLSDLRSNETVLQRQNFQAGVSFPESEGSPKTQDKQVAVQRRLCEPRYPATLKEAEPQSAAFGLLKVKLSDSHASFLGGLLLISRRTGLRRDNGRGKEPCDIKEKKR
jgi:hypothetical protein